MKSDHFKLAQNQENPRQNRNKISSFPVNENKFYLNINKIEGKRVLRVEIIGQMNKIDAL